MESNIIKPSIRDYTVKLFKGVLEGLPFVGGVLGELLDIAVIPQQQKKLIEWCNYVDKTLSDLIERRERSKEQIFNDEQLLSIIQKTTRIYVNNIEEQKKPIMQAYLRSSIKKEIPLDKKYIFLRIIDELTESQLLILKDVYDNEISDTYLYQSQLERVLSEKFTNSDDQYLNLLIKGLQDFHLLNYDSANVVVNGSNQWHMKTSKIGKEFFEFLLKT